MMSPPGFLTKANTANCTDDPRANLIYHLNLARLSAQLFMQATHVVFTNLSAAPPH